MKQLYLVWYVVETGSDLWWLWTIMWMKTEWKSTRFWSQQITTEKINLPKIYSILARKENVWIAKITILWISLLPSD